MVKMWLFFWTSTVTKRLDFFSSVPKRFCPRHSNNVFVLVLAHLEPELKLFEVWEMIVLQIIITIMANVINLKALAQVLDELGPKQKHF